MKTATISYARNNLSALIRFVREGSEVLILDRTRPVARITRIAEADTDWDRRCAGMARRGMVRPPAKKLTRRDLASLKPIRLRGPVDLAAALSDDREDRI
jgi:antitoxin (DNA-binding transcriptional repressor) of toxin-antitoxin stability system